MQASSTSLLKLSIVMLSSQQAENWLLRAGHIWVLTACCLVGRQQRRGDADHGRV